MKTSRLLGRFLLSSGVAAVVAVVTVIGLTVVDLYLVGHGHLSINREIVVWEALGVRLSPASMVLLAATVGAGGGTWYALSRAD